MHKSTKVGLSLMMMMSLTQFGNVNAYGLEPLLLTDGKQIEKGIEKQKKTNDEELLRIYNNIKTTAPKLSDDLKKIVLPAVDNSKYEISLYGSSNKAVIDLKGNVTQPLEDMEVNLFYKVTNKETKENLHMDDPYVVKVNGKYHDGENLKNRPQVMPGIREWKGNEGRFIFNNNIIVENEDMREAANIVKYYIEEMTGTHVKIQVGKASKGDILLTYDTSITVGKEGYTMDIGDITKVSAPTKIGIIYAGATLTQMLMQDKNHSLPKGEMRDYPQFEVRSTMLDVARFYMPLDYLEEVTKYAAFFKLNEIHVHINDDGGEQNTAFRVESKKYPDINKGIKKEEIYKQEDYKSYQKEVKKYGIDVVTEIDSPAHCGSVRFVDKSIMKDGAHIDLSNRKSIEFMQSLYDEFLDGKDPVFQNKKFNIGTDEYPNGHNEEMRAYMDEMIKYVNKKGYKTRLWSGLNVEGENYGGKTPITNDAQFHLWSLHYADLDIMLDGEYPIINNNDGILYTVPGAGYYNDYLNVKNIYNNWESGDVGKNQVVQEGHPLLLGAESAFWYDIKTGMSQFDVFKRVKDQIALMSEKGWFGEKQNYQTYEQFIKRVDDLMNSAPGANPSREVASKNELVAAYDFTKIDNNKVKDQSVNNYEATINNGLILDKENNGLLLDGKGYISLPFDSLSFDYTINMNININSATPKNALLFSGTDGQMYANYEGSGKLAYARKGYVYYIDAVIPKDVLLNLTIVCNNRDLSLYIDGVFVGKGQYYGPQANKQESGTFVMPCEKIGSGIKGYIRNLTVYNTVKEDVAKVERVNVALNKDVSVSGVEGGYNEDGSLKYPQFAPSTVVDGNLGTRNSLDQNNDAWIVVDLKEEFIIDDIDFIFNEAPKSYKLQISLDGKNWDTIETVDFGDKQGDPDIVKNKHFDNLVKARYVKYQQIEMFESKHGWGRYSGNFKEIEVYGTSYKKINDLIVKSEEVLKHSDGTHFYIILENNLNDLKKVLNGGLVNSLNSLCCVIQNQLKQYELGNIETVDTDKRQLKKLLDEELDATIYDKLTFDKYLKAKEMGLSVYANIQATQDRVDVAVKQIVDAKNGLSVKPAYILTHTGGIYNNNDLIYAFDGNKNTCYWQFEQRKGQEVRIDFNKAFDLQKIRIESDGDYLEDGDLQVSYDGENFETIRKLEAKKDQTIQLNLNKSIKSVRLLCTKDSENWWKINEITINDELLVDKNVLEQEINKGDTLNPKDYIKASYDSYMEVLVSAKKLLNDVNVNQIMINSKLDELKTAYSNLSGTAKKQGLEEILKNKYEADHYTNSTYSNYLKAYQKAQEVCQKESNQEEIDNALWDVREAILRLVDIENINQKISLAQKYKSDDYTTASFSLLVNALDKAKDLDGLSQLEVDALAMEIESAISHLVKIADKTFLNQLLDHVKSLDKEMYTKESYDALMNQYDEALKALEDRDITQEQINELVNKIEVAIDQLKLVEVHATPDNGNGSDKVNETNQNNQVKTGDENNIFALFVMFICSSLVMFFIKKRKYTK